MKQNREDLRAMIMQIKARSDKSSAKGSHSKPADIEEFQEGGDTHEAHTSRENHPTTPEIRRERSFENLLTTSHDRVDKNLDVSDSPTEMLDKDLGNVTLPSNKHLNSAKIHSPSGPSNSSVILILNSLLVKTEQLLTRTKNLETKVDNIFNYVRTADDAKKPIGWPCFPLQDRAALLEFELFLADSENYEFSVAYFSIMAGKGDNEGEMAINLCKKLFKTELAAHLNWLGTEKKLGLKAKKIGSFILDACKKAYNGNVKPSRVSSQMSGWLRNRSEKKISPTEKS